MNVAEQYAEFKYEAEKVRDCVESDAYPFATVFPWLDQGGIKVNRKLGLLKGDSTQAIQTGATAFSYDLPADIIDRLVDEEGVILYFSGVEQPTSLELIDLPEARRFYGNFTNPNASSGARHYWFDDRNPGKLMIGWPPQRSGNLVISYTRRPRPIRHKRAIFAGADIGITALVENGSTAVTFSAPVPKTLIALYNSVPYFEFGLGSRELMPADWHRVAGVTTDGNGDVTDLTLAAAFEEDDVELSDFLLAHVSEFVQAAPSIEIAWLPIHWALHLAFKPGDVEASQLFRQRFMTELSAAAPSRKAMSFRRGTPVREHR